MLEVEKPADMKAHIGKQIGTSEWVTGRSGDDRQVRRGDRRSSVDPRRRGAGEARDARRQDDRARLSDAVAAAAAVARHLHIRKRSRGINYGSNKVRFTAPVPAGSRVRLHQTLKNVEDIEGGVRMTFDSQIEVEGSSRPALVAETMGLAFD